MTEQERSDHLPADYRLAEFEIERVLGSGGFGVVYLARDTQLDQLRAIKEFLPGLVAERSAAGQVTARTGSQAASYRTAYQQGLKRFLAEAKTLAALDHPGVPGAGSERHRVSGDAVLRGANAGGRDEGRSAGPGAGATDSGATAGRLAGGA